MQYATMRGQSAVTVNIPKLEGGINLSDLPTQVEDNQLTDARNMWWHQGVLRTRPGLKEIGGGDFANGLIGKSRISEREEILFQAVDDGGDSATVRADSFSVKGRSTIGTFVVDGADGSAFGVRVDDEKPYLIFTSDGIIRHAAADVDTELAEPYVPRVTVERYDDEKRVYENVLFEGYNMLMPEFECSFSTDGKRETFYLPKESVGKSPITVSIMLYNKSARTTRTVTKQIAAPSSGNVATASITDVAWGEICSEGEENGGGTNSISLYFDWTSCQLTVRACNMVDAYASYWPLPTVQTNNLVVTAGTAQKGQREAVCRMTKAVWFGGTRSGLDSGTRLFVTGNPDKPHLVHWSDVNKPLYFPEGNYFYVGDADQRVTALAQQGDLLVIFKEHQLYYTQYVAGNTITADDLISGAVTDIASLTAQFPLTPLHSTIGCDCPDTIRLVNNRLVWATSDAHVYMLPSVNQYSERNVRDITALIRRDLEKHTADELKAAVATEYKGHYMLILPDGTTYLLDVGNSAFQSFAYYASEKKANRALPWYIWKLGRGAERFWSAVSTGDELRLMANDATSREYIFDGDTDDGAPIVCSFTTKLFDFGRADLKKAITHLYIGVADGQPNMVRVSYITDAYTAEDAYIIDSGGDHNEREPGYIRTHRLTPNIHRVLLFGIRCDSEGAMAVDGIQIKMKPQGVVR